MIFAVDASGSTTPAQFAFMSRWIKAHSKSSSDRIIFFDHHIGNMIPVRSFDEYETTGCGGGTSIQAVFDWADKNAKGQPLVVLSDGMFMEDAKTHGIRATLVLNEKAPTGSFPLIVRKCFEKVISAGGGIGSNPPVDRKGLSR